MSFTLSTLKQNVENLLSMEGEEFTVKQISNNLGASAALIMGIILATPMCLPFANIPGLAQIVSLAMGIIFFRLFLGKDELWLPEKVNQAKIKRDGLHKICNFLLKWIDKSGRVFKPRLQIFTSEIAQKLLYLFIIFLAFVLALPLIIPFTNFLPAIAILIITFGIINQDGLLTIFGIIIGVISTIFAFFILFLGVEVVIKGLEYVGINL